MDRLKSRVWSKKCQCYIDPQNLYLNIGSGTVDIRDNFGGCMYSADDDHTIEQSPGLKDCNEKLIYEGDIVEVSDAIRGKQIAVVKHCTFNSQKSSFSGYLIGILYIKDEYKTVYPFAACCDYTVIGNIHESPELLEA